MKVETWWGKTLYFITSTTTYFWLFFIVVGIALSINLLNLVLPAANAQVISNIPHIKNLDYTGIIISAFGAILAVSLGYVYPGRLIFVKPPEIMLTSLKVGWKGSIGVERVQKDVVILPISCVNTGAISRSLSFALVATVKGGGRFNEFTQLKYPIFTNDFKLEAMEYSKWKRARQGKDTDVKFEDVADFQYMEPFIVKGRGVQVKCVSSFHLNSLNLFP